MTSTKNRTMRSRAPAAKGKPTPTRRVDKQTAPGGNTSRSKTGTHQRKTLVSQVCSVMDPFCVHAKNAKYPDLTSALTLPYQQHERFTLSTSATGQISTLFYPSYGYNPYFPQNSFAAGVATYGPKLAGINYASVSSVRLVSFGIIIRSVVAPLSASGVVRVRMFTAPDPSTLATLNVSTYNCDDYMDIPLNVCKETCVVLKRVDETAKFWKTPGEYDAGFTAPTQTKNGFGQVLINIDGGPASLAVLDIEYILHWEVKMLDSDVLAQIATPSPQFHPAVQSATDKVQSTAKSIFTNGVGQLATYVETHAAAALAELISGL